MRVDPLLITRFLRNECNEEEKALVAAWLDEHPELLEQYLGEAEWTGFDAGEMMAPERSASMKQTVMNAVRKPVKTKRINYQKLAVAATVCVLLSASAYLWWQHRPSVQPADSIAAVTDNKMIIISNPSTEEKPLRMPDGSLVIVAAHSTVKYPKMFRSNRSVQLEGSALFDVSKDETHPFRVSAGVLQVTVLGTRFRIDADKGNSDMNVKLFSGKIRVGVGEKETDLLPGKEFHYQQGVWIVRTFEHNKKDAAVRTSSTEDNTTPLSNTLVFDNRPLSAVLATLQARFNTPIHYKDKMIRKYYFSGEFNATDSLDQILKTICTLNGLQIKEDSTGYTLLPDKQ
ncbi:MAG TPA: FecR domain-containing protein [Chitinophaga sp.]